MVLQKLLFPSTEICSREKMYYKGDNIAVFMEDECCFIPKGETLSTHTYFNSFSVGKWKKYTSVDNLNLTIKIRGEILLYIRHARKMNNQIKDKIIAEKRIISEEINTECIQIPLTENEGVYYFQLKALNEGAHFYGGAYETQVEESCVAEVKLAIGICTFRREEYIAQNIEVLKKNIIENQNSPLYQKLEIFISDNSKTLDTKIATEDIHIFPNRNLGGAGGFTRAMIEIKKVSKDKGFTHFLLMDDDIRLNQDSLHRTYVMLCLLKAKYKDAFIGGHMLKIDAQNIQSEAADYWDIIGHHPVKYNYNLENLEFIIKNEIEDSVNYFGWWYCCMPINVISDNNLPLPIFIKRDDIEYGLRNGKQFITLNGICVWHEPFEYKNASYLEYYYFRNMCIINSRHRLSFSAKRLIKEVRKRVKTFVLRYRYKEAELSLLGVHHYLKGIDWLKAQDAEKLNSEITKLGYKKEPIEKINFVFTHGIYERNLSAKKGKNQKIKTLLTLNGWLRPANKDVIVPMSNPSATLFYRANTVVNYEEISNTAFVTKRDYHALFCILKMYLQTVKMIKKNYRRITLEYRDRYDELINLKFWNEYLFEEKEVEEIKSNLNMSERPKNNRYQFRELVISYVLQAFQLLLFWLPVKKNRVMVYIHDRKGFTCNPKYIVKKLVECYGNKLEIIWATMHPETCQEIEDLGVKVIKSDTPEQIMNYMRTRFFITNDAFPTWAMKRWNQKWMNTWHAAMNYKHIGYEYLAPMSSFAAKIFKIKNRQPNFYLSGSDFFTKDTAKSFKFNERIFLPTGLPRNDILFEEQREIAKKVKAYYNIDQNKKLVIFAPTFRRGMKSDTFDMDFKMICKALEERFGGEWVMLFRNHNFVVGKQKYSGAIDVSAYHDMQELLCASDVLISDYSSCLYDFCLTKRPIFMYCTDLDNYMLNDRTFAYALEKWPYPIAKSNEELVDRIKTFNEKSFLNAIGQHMKDIGAYDNGTASQQVVDLVAKYCI